MLKCFVMNCVDLPDPLTEETALQYVPEWRREKTMRLRMPEDRRLSLGAGILLSRIFAESDISPEEISIDPHGRPCSSGICFSLSHSAEYAALAVSDRPVGCDIERMKRPRIKVAERYFSADERARIRSAAESGNEAAEFYRIWTARESYSKMTGEGLRLAFSDYETLLREERRERTPEENDHFRLPSLEVLRGGKKEDCLIRQSVVDTQYMFSVCGSAEDYPSLEYRRALI